MRRVKVADVLRLQRRRITIDSAEEYTLIGVYSFGKGIFHRAPQLGVDLGDYKFSEVKPGDLVLSNIQSWEGAIGYATKADQDTIGTHRFLSYTAIDEEEIDTNWARYFFLSPAGFPLIQNAAPGSVTRNRTLSVERFEAIEIPLLDIDEQRRIAAHLDRVSGLGSSVSQSLAAATTIAACEMLPGLADAIFSQAKPRWVEAGSLYTVISDVIHPGDSHGDAESFVGLQHVESHTGRNLGSLPIGDEKGRKFRFQPGDIVFGYLRPYLNKVWIADRVGLCSVDQYVLRPHEGVDATVLGHSLRSQSTLAQSETLTHNLQLPRLRSKLLQGIRVVDPRSVAGDVGEKLDATLAQILDLADAQRRRAALASAVFPSALNRAFAGLA